MKKIRLLLGRRDLTRLGNAGIAEHLRNQPGDLRIVFFQLRRSLQQRVRHPALKPELDRFSPILMYIKYRVMTLPQTRVQCSRVQALKP